MKTKSRILSMLLSAALALSLLASCGGEAGGVSSVGTSSLNNETGVPVSSEDVSSDNISSEGNSSADITSGGTSNVSSDSSVLLSRGEEFEGYGAITKVTEFKDYGIARYDIQKKDEDKKLLSSAIVYHDLDNNTFDIVSTSEGADGSFVTDYFSSNAVGKGIDLYLCDSSDSLYFYELGTKKNGEIPLVKSNGKKILAFDREFGKFASSGRTGIVYQNGVFYWSESVASEGSNVFEEVFCKYDIAANKQETVYTSDGVTWIYNVFSDGEGLYLKLAKAAFVLPPDSTGGVYDCFDDLKGDLLFYDGSKLTTVKEDIYGFKIEDGKKLFKETEADEWTELD